MKNRWLFIILLVLFIMLSACKSSHEHAWTDAPAVPEEVVFQVSCICDLEDAEGKTLHCGGPNDFSGTIEGRAAHMTGESPAYFEFTVPYSDIYQFVPSSTSPSVMAMGGLVSRISLSREAEKIEWRMNGWTVKSDGTESELTLNIDSRERYVAVLELRLDTEAELSMGLRHIALFGLSDEAKMTIWDFERMMKTTELTVPVQNGAAAIVFDELENDQIELVVGGESENLLLEWSKLG